MNKAMTAAAMVAAAACGPAGEATLIGWVGERGFIAVTVEGGHAVAQVNLDLDQPWRTAEGRWADPLLLASNGLIVDGRMNGDRLTGTVTVDGQRLSCSASPIIEAPPTNVGVNRAASNYATLSTDCSSCSYCYKWCTNASTGQRCRFGCCSSNYNAAPTSCYYP